jgi:transposase
MVPAHKNYMFAGSDCGGRAAAFHTLIQSARMNGRDPEAYLRDVLARIFDTSWCAVNSIKNGTVYAVTS